MLKTRNLRLRELKQPALGHVANKRSTQDLNSVCTDSKAYTFCENADRIEIADRAFIHRERKRKSKK